MFVGLLFRAQFNDVCVEWRLPSIDPEGVDGSVPLTPSGQLGAGEAQHEELTRGLILFVNNEAVQVLRLDDLVLAIGKGPRSSLAFSFELLNDVAVQFVRLDVSPALASCAPLNVLPLAECWNESNRHAHCIRDVVVEQTNLGPLYSASLLDLRAERLQCRDKRDLNIPS